MRLKKWWKQSKKDCARDFMEEWINAYYYIVDIIIRKYKLIAGTVNVQLRDNEFNDFSHQKKLEVATANTKDIYIKAKELLKEMYKGEPIRLISLKVDQLSNKGEKQISLFDIKDNKKQEKIDETLDALKEKFGYTSITRAGKLGSEKNIKLK